MTSTNIFVAIAIFNYSSHFAVSTSLTVTNGIGLLVLFTSLKASWKDLAWLNAGSKKSLISTGVRAVYA